MSAFAALALTNNAAATVTFNPQSIDSSGVAKWLTSESIFDSKMVATMSVAVPKNGSSVSRIKMKISIPVMDTIDVNKKVADCYGTMEFVLPKLATSTTRLDLRKFCDTMLTNAIATAAFTSIEAIY